MSIDNEHRFKFSLPLVPNQTVKDDGLPCELLMDSKQMKGVTGGHLRFGANGFTNVVIEYEASCLTEFVAELTAQVNLRYQDPQEIFGGVFDKAAEQIPSMGSLMLDGDDKAEFVQRVIEIAAEQFK